MNRIVATIERIKDADNDFNKNDCIVITIRNDEENEIESTRFNIYSLIEKYKDLDGVTIREGLFVKDIGIDDLSVFINLTVDFRRI